MSHAPRVIGSGPPPLWRNTSFHLLWSSTFASGVGDRLIMNAALPMLGYGSEGVDNSGITAGIDFFFFLPYLLWAPIAGWLADRLPRKWLMFWADELRGLIVLGAFTYMPAGSYMVPADQQWKVWLTIGLVGVMAATFVPAKMSIVPNVVHRDLLGRANSAVVSMGIIGNLIGFIVGGLIVEKSLDTMILMSAMFYLISGWFWAFLKTPYRSDAPGQGAIEASGSSPMDAIRDIGRGVRYAWEHRVVRVLIITAALVWTGTAIYMPALAVVNVEVYGGSAADFMFVAAPIGLGMLIGAAGLAVINSRLGNELLIAAGLIGCGLFIGLQMVVPSYAVGVMLALLTGISASVLLVPVYTLMQRTTADHIRGRVFAAKEVLTESGKVAIAGMIWQMPGTDPYMRPAAGGLAAVLFAVAVCGIWRFVLRGPAPTRALNFLWRVGRLLADGLHQVRWRGRAYVPRDRGVILVSNHRSGIDPLLIQSGLGRVVRWMMTSEYHLPWLNWLWKRIHPIPIRQGDEREAVGRAIAELRKGEVVGIFPEGGINRSGEPLLEMHPGVVLLARRSGAVVIPVWVDGPPAMRSPLLAYLKPSRSRVTFGPPVELGEGMGRDEAMAEIKRRLLELKAGGS